MLASSPLFTTISAGEDGHSPLIHPSFIYLLATSQLFFIRKVFLPHRSSCTSLRIQHNTDPSYCASYPSLLQKQTSLLFLNLCTSRPFHFSKSIYFPYRSLYQPISTIIMAETSFLAHIGGMLRKSDPRYNHIETNLYPLTPIAERPESEFEDSSSDESACGSTSFETETPVPTTLLDSLLLITSGDKLPARPAGPFSEDFDIGLQQALSTFTAIFPPGANKPAPVELVKETSIDAVNDIAVSTSRHIFKAAQDQQELSRVSRDLGVFENTEHTMAGRFPALSTSNLPTASAEEARNIASPARGTAMLNNIFKSVRVPEFRFKWQFWAEKGQSGSAASKDKATSEEYASRPKPLGNEIITIKEFYQHFNNIPTDSLKLRDSIHLFHLGVKPLWEDPRNTRGGAWYFKVKEIAPQMWHELCLLAVGDVLQGAVETKRETFNDDICGLSYSVRWNSVQIAVWNRDADNKEGIEKLLKVILEKLSEECRPQQDQCWYKAHKEHKGYVAPA
ncbi:translation initiation factor eIF 4e-like domain-containing protein [Clohesyomyces aquaticus]|uniref:Translation initiation factor eIF 4e-like domain-containing protein n=1 Tax=Clohesyomyces aquaticus TaxID=1231657 RepID=A0A1Y2AAH8_9PLEO|nr:translation initiation factor eIF 4e-like domain-containing protein [Clohesyomyces aquaticus]